MTSEVQLIILLITVSVAFTVALIWIDHNWRRKYKSLENAFGNWMSNNLKEKLPQRRNLPKLSEGDIPLLYIGIEPKNGKFSYNELDELIEPLRIIEEENGHTLRYINAEKVIETDVEYQIKPDSDE